MGGTGLAPTPAWGVIGGEGARAQRSCLGWGFQSKLRINFYKTLKMQAQFALTNATISEIWGGLQEGGEPPGDLGRAMKAGDAQEKPLCLMTTR